MASIGAQEASSSTSSMPRCSYRVFLSFNGEDTGRTFTDHLYTALLGAGFRTFRDKNGLPRGEDSKSELEKAIKEARSSVIVFSKNYASSRWCLEELVMILELKRTSGHIILPVFYDVDPSQVRKQMGCFKEAFDSYEERFKVETNEREKEYLRKEVEGWRAALREVADLAGMVLQNQADGHEAKFIQKIVEVIGDKLTRTGLYVLPHLIGIEPRVKDINSWLQDESDDVGIAVIYGMGGIGKTTIAKIVYNSNFGRFEASSFLANIREVSEQPKGVVNLQRQLLSDILKRKKEKISSVDAGIMKMKYAIGCKRVLLVLDDVDQRDKFGAVIGMRDWFLPGSKIILTTRNKKLLKDSEVSMRYKLDKFNDDEALELFSWHAFGQDHPIEGYIKHSKMVVQHCGGLPLALQVLGSSLSGRSLDIWRSAIQKLRAIPDSQILKKLKISYDSLQDDHDQNLFLHIACFFIGKGKNFTVRILDGCNFYSTVGIQNLIQRCLLTINEHKKLTMHQQIRDMGREIVRQESPREPGKRSRLWRHKDSFDVLREKIGTQTIEGLILNVDMPAKKINIPHHHFEGFVDKSTLISDGNVRKRRRLSLLSWLPLNSALTESFSESDEAKLETNAFSRMRELQILQLNNVCLTGCYEEFPKKLRWLCWHGFSSNSIPNNFPMENLVVLDMRNSSLKQFWNGTKILISLKILDLSYSHCLANSPDFSQLPNLEKLILKGCINMAGVHDSIGELGRLVLLNLRDCKNLRKLPIEIVQLKSLEKLILTGCSRLDKLPSDLSKMESLKVLHADGMNQLSSAIGEVEPWYKHLWNWVSNPKSIPKPICFSLTSLPRLLVRLNLAKCNLSNDGVPGDLGILSSLETLDLSENPICSLPGSIKGLTRLGQLELFRCTKLQSLPELPMSLKVLTIDECRALEMVTNLPNLFQGLALNNKDCDKLVEVQGLWKLEPVGGIDPYMINNLGLADLDSMRMLEVEFENKLTQTSTRAPLQGLYECGIYSIFLHGSEIPDWFKYNLKSKGSSISFSIPSTPNLKIRGLNVCVVYGHTAVVEEWRMYWDFFIRFNNKTKNLKWAYCPTIHGIADEDKDVIWLSHWTIANLLMESGDEVNVSVEMKVNFQEKEFGVHILYEDEEEEKGTQNNNNYPNCHQHVIDLSVYQMSDGDYFLCNTDEFLRTHLSASAPGTGWPSHFEKSFDPHGTQSQRGIEAEEREHNREHSSNRDSDFEDEEEEEQGEYDSDSDLGSAAFGSTVENGDYYSDIDTDW